MWYYNNLKNNFASLKEIYLDEFFWQLFHHFGTIFFAMALSVNHPSLMMQYIYMLQTGRDRGDSCDRQS